MPHSQSEKTKKRRFSVLLLLLLLLLLSLTFGGVSAYLSMSGNVSNTLSVAPEPGVSVSGTTVTVKPNGYAVYLRVAVDACWKSTDGSILAEEPAMTFTVGTDWKQIGSFYYYLTPLVGNPDPLVLPITHSSQPKDGYQVVYNVAAQVIQAHGALDDGSATAVQDAWGVTPG